MEGLLETLAMSQEIAAMTTEDLTALRFQTAELRSQVGSLELKLETLQQKADIQTGLIQSLRNVVARSDDVRHSSERVNETLQKQNELLLVALQDEGQSDTTARCAQAAPGSGKRQRGKTGRRESL